MDEYLKQRRRCAADPENLLEKKKEMREANRVFGDCMWGTENIKGKGILVGLSNNELYAGRCLSVLNGIVWMDEVAKIKIIVHKDVYPAYSYYAKSDEVCSNRMSFSGICSLSLVEDDPNLRTILSNLLTSE